MITLLLTLLGCQETPATVPTVRLAERYGCALDTEGQVFCWGQQYEQSPDTDEPPPYDTAVVALAPGGTYRFLAVHGNNNAVVFEGDGSTRVYWPGEGRKLDDFSYPVIGIDGVEGGICVLNSDGEIGCTEFISDSRSPETAGWRFVTMGHSGACAIHSDDSWWCLRPFDDLQATHPTIEHIGMSHRGHKICVVTPEHTLACEGFDDDSFVPDVDNAVRVAVDRACVCALLDDATVDCGCVDPEKEAAMSAVEAETGIADLDLWDRVCVSYQADGSVACWGGSNEFGQSEPGPPPE